MLAAVRRGALCTVDIGTAAVTKTVIFAHSLDPIQKLPVDVLKGMRASCAFYIAQRTNIYRGDARNSAAWAEIQTNEPERKFEPL